MPTTRSAGSASARSTGRTARSPATPVRSRSGGSRRRSSDADPTTGGSPGRDSRPSRRAIRRYYESEVAERGQRHAAHRDDGLGEARRACGAADAPRGGAIEAGVTRGAAGDGLADPEPGEEGIARQLPGRIGERLAGDLVDGGAALADRVDGAE